MNKLKLAKTLGVLLLTFCAVNSAQANGVLTLADLVNLDGTSSGESITVDDKVFSGWTVSQLVSDDAFIVDLANIEVTGLSAPGGNPLADPGPGLAFTVLNNGMSVVGDGIYSYLDFTVNFWATVTDPNNYIKDVSLSTTGAVTNNIAAQDLGVFIKEDVNDAANAFIGSTNVGANILNGVIKGDLANEVSFAPQSQIQVSKNILIWSAGQGDSVSLTGFTQHFSQGQVQAPEPTMLLLLSAGLIAAGYAKRRQV